MSDEPTLVDVARLVCIGFSPLAQDEMDVRERALWLALLDYLGE